MAEAIAKLRNLRISAKKVGLVAGAVRNLGATEALAKLQVIFKKSVSPMSKLIASAVANMQEKYNVSADDLVIKKVVVNKAPDMKRWRPAAFGSGHPFRKHSCHIEIVLATKAGATVTSKDKKQAKIETVDLTKTEKKAPIHSAESHPAGKTKIKSWFNRPAKTKIAPVTKGKDNINVKKG